MAYFGKGAYRLCFSSSFLSEIQVHWAEVRRRNAWKINKKTDEILNFYTQQTHITYSVCSYGHVDQITIRWMQETEWECTNHVCYTPTSTKEA
ncbi:hypothetical protein TNCV_4367431 [Trichonephila clavipes]|nr:hypothetical protein TNCV_4367431 [Trichonephila clavipes]